jgi:hypothetical protein
MERMKRTYKMLSFLVLAAAVISCALLVSENRKIRETVAEPADLSTEAAGPYRTADAGRPGGVDELLGWWDERLEAAEKAGRWDVAADYAYRQAAYYRSIGNESEATRWYETSDAYWGKDGTRDRRFDDGPPPPPGTVTLTPYVSLPAEPLREPAKFEPQSGTYLGMFGIFDWTAVAPQFGRYHPIGLTYAGWRKDESDTRNYFPARLINSIRSAGGGALQIGWEPQYGLDRVEDDEYVRSFARQARESGIPIFLRYASEMNGGWVPWYDTPENYVEKFRLIARIMKEEAPNVAMVWSPNFWPNDNIDAYYPGDEYVDWVGFSLYGSPFFDGKEDFSRNLIDYFVPLYEKYAHKPIMISEGAIGYYSRRTNQDYSKWGEGQLANMYAFLPRMFPQVKAITYFNMRKSRSESQNADFLYDLSENPLMFDLYRRLIRDDYFLSRVEQGAATRRNVRYEPLESAAKAGLEGKHTVFSYVKMPLDIQPRSVAYFQGDRRLAVAYEPPWEVELDFSALDPAQELTIVVYNGKQETMESRSFVWAKR